MVHSPGRGLVADNLVVHLPTGAAFVGPLLLLPRPGLAATAAAVVVAVVADGSGFVVAAAAAAELAEEKQQRDD